MTNNDGHTMKQEHRALWRFGQTSIVFLPVALTIGLLSTMLSGRVVIAQTHVATNPAITPAAHMDDPEWAERHESIKREAKTHPDTQLLLIGDSITNNYVRSEPPDKNFLPIWKEFYEPRKALNLGMSGDTTANVLWRLDHGEVDGLQPKVAIVMIGTNNTDRENQTAEQTESGINAVVGSLEEHLPRTRVLLLGILPTDITSSKTARDLAVDQYLADCYGENPRVTYLDIGSIFFNRGVLNRSLFYDPRDSTTRGKPLHPDTNGQRLMAEAIEPTLAKLMEDAPRIPHDHMTEINTALIPVDRLEVDSYDWYARHHAELILARTIRPKVVLIGDSITHFWGGSPAGGPVNGPAAWQHVFGSANVINMGFGWDRTQNVLWRLRQGELDGLTPEWIVLEIGTNNLTASSNARANSPVEVADAIETICAEIHKKSPASHVILMAILPRGAKNTDPLRQPILETNRMLSQRFATSTFVRFLDIGSHFLDPDGSIPKTLMPDGTHPSDAGYLFWADGLIAVGVQP